jgi:hypothetical protein
MNVFSDSICRTGCEHQFGRHWLNEARGFPTRPALEPKGSRLTPKNTVFVDARRKPGKLFLNSSTTLSTSPKGVPGDRSSRACT